MASQHQRDLQSYFQRKNSRGPSLNSSGENARRNRGSNIQKQQARQSYSGLPDELLVRVFSFLDISALISVSQVCHDWYRVANDNCLWRDLYRLQKLRSNPGEPLHCEHGYWKHRCLEELWERRVNRVKRLTGSGRDKFSGVQANVTKALVYLDVRFRLELTLSDKTVFTVYNMDSKDFSMTSSVRFQSLSWPLSTSVVSYKLFAVCPLSSGNSRLIGPCKESLLCSDRLDLSCRLPQLGNDTCLQVRKLKDGWIQANYNDGCDLAWLAINLHHYLLTDRILQSLSDQTFLQEPSIVPFDDVDSKLGLYGYTAAIELRNFRTSFCREQFRDLEAHTDGKGFALIRCICSEKRWQHTCVDRKPQLLWKTDCFKGKISGLCIGDVTLTDKDGLVVWSCKDLLKMELDEELNTLDYQGLPYTLHTADEAGFLRIQLIWMEEEEKGFITFLEIGLSLTHINGFYGTKH